MFEGFPFLYRVVLLLGLMVVGAAFDYWRRGEKAQRHREYTFICIAGVLGGFVGLANDWITSSLSPDYFILGKGLQAGSGLRWRAGEYGLQVGFSAGMIAGAFCMFVGVRNSLFSAEQMRRWLRSLWMPVAGAVSLGLLLPLVAGGSDPFGLSTGLGPLLSTDQIARFKRVWWIHIGLYTGLIIGLVIMISCRKSHEAWHPESG